MKKILISAVLVILVMVMTVACGSRPDNPDSSAESVKSLSVFLTPHMNDITVEWENPGKINIFEIYRVDVTEDVLDPEKDMTFHIADYEKIAGLEETIRCMLLIPALNESALITILQRRQNGFLWQKTGYILSQLNDDLHLSREFFDACKIHLPGGRRSLEKQPAATPVWNPEWQLFAPARFRDIVDKGVNETDEL